MSSETSLQPGAVIQPNIDIFVGPQSLDERVGSSFRLCVGGRESGRKDPNTKVCPGIAWPRLYLVGCLGE